MWFSICPYDIVMVTAYSEADFNQSILLALGVVMERSFIYVKDPFETSVSYIIIIVWEQTEDHSTRRNARGPIHRTICHARVLR